jgi:thiamine pyrophosphokinase
VSTATLDAARARGVVVETHPREKNETDLELALAAACARGATRVTVLDGRAGRLDHFLATALLLAHPRYRTIEVRAVVDNALVTVVPAGAKRELTGQAGAVVTLLAVGGTARDVHTSGLRYTLDGDTLEPGSTRGVSNEMLGEHAAVWIADGALLAIQPSRGARR